MPKLTSKQVALSASFAALLVAVGRLPGIPIIGGGVGEIKFTVVLAPVVGVLLGPWLGAFTAFIGALLSWIIPPTTIMGLIFLPCDPIAALVAGLLARKGRLGWGLASLIIALLNLLWYATPIGLELAYYPVLHWVALALVLVFRGRTSEYLRSFRKGRLMAGVMVSSFGGLMANHMAGNLIFIQAIGLVVPLKALKDAVVSLGMVWVKLGIPKVEGVVSWFYEAIQAYSPWLAGFIPKPTGELSLLATLFAIVLPVAAIERVLMLALATIIGTGLLISLRRARLLPST